MTKTKINQQLIRGALVKVADSFGRAQLRSTTQAIVSKGTVPCKQGGRCAGDWCIGLAVYVAEPESLGDDKSAGWRTGAAKICLTHLKDENDELLVSPSVVSVARAALAPVKVVTWEDLANAAADQDFQTMIGLARALKRENESLSRRLIEVQDRLIDQLE